MTMQECYKAIGGNYEAVLGRLHSEALIQRFTLKFLEDQSYLQLKQALEKYDTCLEKEYIPVDNPQCVSACGTQFCRTADTFSAVAGAAPAGGVPPQVRGAAGYPARYSVAARHPYHCTDGFFFPRVGEFFNGFTGRSSLRADRSPETGGKGDTGRYGHGAPDEPSPAGRRGERQDAGGAYGHAVGCDNGFQACMMVPTEILARQHFASITKMVEGVGVRVAVLTGSTKKRERDGILEELASGGSTFLSVPMRLSRSA